MFIRIGSGVSAVCRAVLLLLQTPKNGAFRAPPLAKAKEDIPIPLPPKKQGDFHADYLWFVKKFRFKI